MTISLSGDLAASEIIRMLNMSPHPEGGHFVETHRSTKLHGERSAATSIYYLLQADEVSAWHRVDADEVWLWHSGGPLALTISPPNGHGATSVRLGADLRADERPQFTVPELNWQTAESLGAWTLVSCVVAPGFEFTGFELAPADWRPVV
ncbi:MAG: cupin domain-containing protein [Pseudomonadota bacterium]